MIVLTACTKVSECLMSCWPLLFIAGVVGANFGFFVCAFVAGAHECEVRDE